jgi:aconitate hydratase
VPKYSEFLFEIVDPTFHDRAQSIREAGKHNIIIAGVSYGQGSSREHAALCPMYMGVKAVIAKSLERIHKANLINFGIIPLTFANDADYNAVEQGDEIEIPNIRTIIKQGGKLVARNRSKDTEFEVVYDLSDRQKDTILAGGTLAYMKAQSE